MAPKKVSATAVSAPPAAAPSTSDVEAVVVPSPVTKKAPKAPKVPKEKVVKAPKPKVPRKVKAPVVKKPVVELAEGEKKQRNMSAVSSDFVSQVLKSLSEDLAAKLRVKDVKEMCEAFVKTLVTSVIDGKNVNFTNHMSFARKQRAARVYKNLKTQESITKDKHYVMTMTVKPSLKKQFDAVPVVDVVAGGDGSVAEVVDAVVAEEEAVVAE
jgi:nucleoid DNA-binding protein